MSKQIDVDYKEWLTQTPCPDCDWRPLLIWLWCPCDRGHYETVLAPDHWVRALPPGGAS